MMDSNMDAMMEPMLNCDEVMQQLWDYLDGELTPDRLKAIEAHVQMCEKCSPQVEFERAFLAALDAARTNAVDQGPLRERVMVRLRSMGFTA